MADLKISTYVTKYLNQPNPATGRAFWYDSEVAQAEGVSEKVVGEMRSFAQNCFVQKITDPGQIQIAWDKLQGIKTQGASTFSGSTFGPRASGQPRKVGDVPYDELINDITKIVKGK